MSQNFGLKLLDGQFAKMAFVRALWGAIGTMLVAYDIEGNFVTVVVFFPFGYPLSAT